MAAETPMKHVRKRVLNWSASVALRRLTALARARGVAVASEASLKTNLSRWENGRPVAEVHYRKLFCELYGRTPAELGFPEDTDLDEGAEELRSRLVRARSVDDDTVALFRLQVEAARRADRRFGAVAQHEAVRAQMREVEGLLRFGAASAARPALARALVEAATLAAWEALDRVALRTSWELHETAILAARESGSMSLLAHATAQKAFVLVDLGEHEMAVELMGEARTLADRGVPALLSAWVAAAQGEVCAAAGDRDSALRAFDDADRLLPTEPRDPELPFLFLADGHLGRWRGHVLAAVGDARARGELERALERLPTDFVRARSSTLVDLAVASAAMGERDAALAYSREARSAAGQVASDRQLRRLRSLRLPT